MRLKADEDWIRRINLWRRQQEDFPTLPEAIRRLVNEALARPTKGKPKSGSNESTALEARAFSGRHRALPIRRGRWPLLRLDVSRQLTE